MVLEGLVEHYGLAGLLFVVVVHFAYTAYENNFGTMAHIENRVDAIAVVSYRNSKAHDDVDEEAVRGAVFDGDTGHLPSDFDGEEVEVADGAD